MNETRLSIAKYRNDVNGKYCNVYDLLMTCAIKYTYYYICRTIFFKACY